MRLWSIHPRYLDAAGLVALWREGLLARAVLAGRTRGYRHHPQLDRFRAAPNPLAAVNSYLRVVHAEAVQRGYRFDARKLSGPRTTHRIAVTRGQLDLEWSHLLGKLQRRAPSMSATLTAVRSPRAHPLFRVRPGPAAPWERAKATGHGPPATA